MSNSNVYLNHIKPSQVNYNIILFQTFSHKSPKINLIKVLQNVS